MNCRSDDLIAMTECKENSLSSLAIGQRISSQSIAEGHEEGDEEDSDGDSLPQLDGPTGLRRKCSDLHNIFQIYLSFILIWTEHYAGFDLLWGD